jgi:hypothetical protein
MDRITQQVTELSEAERFQLLVRLLREVSNSTAQSNISAVTSRRRIHRDIPVVGYRLNGFAEPEPAV